MLGAFLFKGDDIDKKVKVLSGGERSRLALVRLLLEPFNLLVLDEPTNHLDMRSKDILKQALLKYDGTLIVVSHDRDFLDSLVSKVFEFRHNRIRENIGGIYDFLRKKKILNLRDLERRDRMASPARRDENGSNKQRYLERKEYERTLRRLRKRLEDSEKLIGSMESELASIDRDLMTTHNHSESAEMFIRYEEIRKKLNREMDNWTHYSHEVEEFIKIMRENGISEV
jgi:ATP-binding cassette subfamily F protein 3